MLLTQIVTWLVSVGESKNILARGRKSL